ncbi:MAG TPA: amidohydrolase family protein [Syntrophorhabdales bacterium]|nr:amidohydrolase family protein [Syntrophorhabdales bacterium]
MKIDVFTHIIPPKYKEGLHKKMPGAWQLKLMEAYPALFDMDARFKVMDKYEGLVQVICTGAPALEDAAPPKDTIELARLANDEMAELVRKYPDRFVAAVACLPMNDVDASLKELDRAIRDLNFRGIQLHSDINGKPLDSPEFEPIFQKMAEYDLPILLHPEISTKQRPDYPNETESKYLSFLIFGWPYRTTLAMTRLAMSGMFDKYPTLKVIAHHCGAMVPFFEQRFHMVYNGHQMRMGYRQEPYLKKGPLDYFRMFYADTVIQSTAALMCGYAFFGADHMLFATDMPYDVQVGDVLTRENILGIERMEIPDFEKKKIFEENVRQIMRLPV